MSYSPLLRLPNTYRAFFGTFPHLHDIQKQAIAPILEGRDLILQSATGTGKTEAVLAPCIERVVRSGRGEAVLYLIPTRALALDLMRRLDPILTQRLGLNLSVRTGDLKRPGGGRPDLVLTTPESLDVMMGSPNTDLRDLLRRVRTVIIDEVHPLLYQYRGRQLSYLIRRLERRRKAPVQKIALSATIADVESVVTFFGFRTDAVRLITTVQREIVPHLVHLKDDESELVALLDDLYEKWHYRKILMFVNSRGRCDRLFGLLSVQGRFQNVCDLHYSNLKSKERREVEHRFRRRSHALCIATSTLELGIDVGDVDGVILFEPPDSIAGFLQRIGRSNRRRGSTDFWGICRGERASSQLLCFLGLLHSARSGLMEASRPTELPSVLVQQILSCLYEKKRISLPALQDLFPERADMLDALFPSLEQQSWLREDPVARLPFPHSPGARVFSLFLGETPVSGCQVGVRGNSSLPSHPKPGEKPISPHPNPLPEGKGTTAQPQPRSKSCCGDDTTSGCHPQGFHPRRTGPDAHQSRQSPPSARLFRGGWRYRDCLLDRRIWSNFPETEEEYSLDLSGEPVADLPKSIVRQLEPGDRVYLAGKRIQVLQIDTGERKRVLAQPADRLDEKELFWLGSGFQVSYEVAQAIRTVLKSPLETADAAALGLFSRTRHLLHDALHRAAATAVLANSLEVSREANGVFFRYWTFLGSVGNLILRWAIEDRLSAEAEAPDGEVEEVYVVSDEIGIDCSQPIDFKKLRLPLDRKGFALWIREHMKFVRPLFSLNAFSEALPLALLVEEMNDHLFDSRLAEAFLKLGTESSQIVSGDTTIFQARRVEPESSSHPPRDLAPSQQAESLLEWGKRRWSAPFPRIEGPRVNVEQVRLTGTLIGEYIRHRQCEAWLHFQLLPPDRQPPKQARIDTELATLRTESGRGPEKKVMEYLQEQGAKVIAMRDIATALSASEDLYVAQPVLSVPSLSICARGVGSVFEAVGIPDLIRVSKTERGALLEVGDIKDSPVPHYSQKWQVAFHGLLLHELTRSGAMPPHLEVSTSGFLITRPIPPAAEPALHSFDLRPFMAAFPSLLCNMGKVLQDSPSQAECTLREHCPGCPWFDYCNGRALREEDILLVPEMSAGTLQKMRLLGLRTLEAAREWFQGKAIESESCTQLAPRQREHIEGRIEALTANRISLYKPKTRLYPANLSTAFFLHLLRDPLTHLPRVVGLHARDSADNAAGNTDPWVWTVVSEEDLASVWLSFSEQLPRAWRKALGNGLVPHLFHFGPRSLQTLFEWEKSSGGPDNRQDFLRQELSGHTTDLRRLILDHFHFSAPGVLTLFSIGRILGFTPELEEPESFFHTEDAHAISSGEWERDERLRRETASRVAAILALQERTWRWASSHLESDLHATREDGVMLPAGEHSPALAYLRFLEEEKRLRERDILSLQELPLRERVERFRAIGPLESVGATLDEEGRFLYRLRIQGEAHGSFSKFREGDFLKLAPVGSADLQGGLPVILQEYDRNAGQVAVLSRQGRLGLSKRLVYSLEEDLTDWNGPRLAHVVRSVFSNPRGSLRRTPFGVPLQSLFSGGWPMEREREHREWVQEWLSAQGARFGALSGLNATQRQALQLPFRYRLGVIEGPPGTGKTHLLGWILIALLCQAQEAGRTLRIGVSALTHQAIDQVLGKVVELVNRHRQDLKPFSVRCLKWGRWKEGETVPRTAEGGIPGMRVEPLSGPEEIARSPHLILGATGYGLYQLFNSQQGEFPAVFDWIIFDEASQVLVPHALLSLVYGKGNFLFIGDVKQLPPIVLGDHGSDTASAIDSGTVHRSILADLLDRYGQELHVRLDLTYRMNEGLCAFPSRTWYDGALRPAPQIAHARLKLPSPPPSPSSGHRPGIGFSGESALMNSAELLDRILDPKKSATLVLADHLGCHQKSSAEVEIVSQLACRLMTHYGLDANRMALISPHRAQNNTMADRLATLLSEHGLSQRLPLVDTVERIQGAERDVIFFSLTTSDPDHLMTELLNNSNRFNVAITRARLKLIVVGSQAFFSAVPHTEEALEANRCFKEFEQFCRERDSTFLWNQADGIRTRSAECTPRESAQETGCAPNP